MSWIVRNIDWVLVISGIATCSMLLQALAPRLAWRFIFGEEAAGPVALLTARSWGSMIFASGLMLVYAAFHAGVRLPILLFAVAGKLGFSLLVFAEPRFRRRRAFVMALADIVIVILLAWYLLARG